MSSFKIKASLGSLPPELLGFLMPDLEALHEVTIADNLTTRQQWLPIKRHWEEQMEFSDPTESIDVLWALAHTCRSLRAVALPRLWAIVHVKRVSELGLLAEVLKEAPYIAPLIRNFSFFWEMNGDYGSCEPYARHRHGSLLDMAFIDRGALWTRMRAMLGCPIEDEFDDHEERVYFHFLYAGVEYAEFGEPPNWWREPEEFGESPSESERIYAERGPSLYTVGPDGRGQDKRIKSPQDLIDCVSQVVKALPKLEAFRWRCPIFPIPASVFQSVKQLRKLKTLYVDVTPRRGNVSNLPLWELASQLEHLSLTLCDPAEPKWHSRIPESEVSEASLTSFELPEQLPVSLPQINALHESIASRTVVAAALGGQLKTLELVECSLHRPFAVRTLLPFWVQAKFDEWHWFIPSHTYPEQKWLSARSSLRPTLAHASLWLPSTGSTKRVDRLLSGDDVQAIAAHFRADGVPDVVEPELDTRRGSRGRAAHPLSIDIYLSWLRADARLAEQVAEAWNRLVQRGEADEVKCRCDRCQPDLEELPEPLPPLIVGALYGSNLSEWAQTGTDSEDSDDSEESDY